MDDTEDLVAQQRATEDAARRLAHEAAEPDEAAQYARRAEKANYLREKLEERAESEADADADAEGK